MRMLLLNKYGDGNEDKTHINSWVSAAELFVNENEIYALVSLQLMVLAMALCLVSIHMLCSMMSLSRLPE